MTGRPVTDQRAFADVWPEVAASVHLALVRRGVDSEAAAEAVQEAAFRALRRLHGARSFDSPDGLLKWAHRVARNVVTDAWRRDARLVGPVPELPVDDATELLEWRELLRSTVAAMDDLHPLQREALLAKLADSIPYDKRAQVRESVRRLRARDQLRRVVGRLPVGWPFRRLRRLRHAVAVAEVAALGVLAVATVVVTTAVMPTPATAVSTSGRSVARADRPRGEAPPAVTTTDQGPHRTADARALVAEKPVVASTRPFTPAVVIEKPTGGVLDIGTRPDEDRALACVETELTAISCVPKPRELVGSVLPPRA